MSVENSAPEKQKKRLLVVSNRLHLTLVKRRGQFSFKESIGGVAASLRTYLQSQQEFDYRWIGWPGGTVDTPQSAELVREAMEQYSAKPVFLAEEEMEAFYHGFCNKTIWALFHYFPSYAEYDQNFWDQYKRVNEIYCRAVLEIARPGDTVWIHDYQLMLLPQMLRARMPDLAIGFFLHIPFPSYEVFRLLPTNWRAEILQGMLGADMVGFHTQDYALYFLRCVERILGYERTSSEVLMEGRITSVEAFPMGIDYEKFHRAAGSKEIRRDRKVLKQTWQDCKIILSIDRLDYSKGILQRLAGYEHFLNKYPEWFGKICLLLVVVPSRVGVEQYSFMKKKIDEAVGRINGRFGALTWTPILYQYRALDFDPLVALYSLADIMLVTPLRDGMNLIAKEYVASRTDQTGVLILSEMAGASKELMEAIVINPTNVEEISDALKVALEMPEAEQKSRNADMQKRLSRYTLNHWAGDFLIGLKSAHERQMSIDQKHLHAHMQKTLLKYRSASTRLVLLDYDGTLVPHAADPNSVAPGPQLLDLLQQLASDPFTRLFIVSGRNRHILENWFGKLPVGMIAEHGMWSRKADGPWSIFQENDDSWKQQFRPILEAATDRLPGSFVEEKEFSLVLHYRKSDPDLVRVRVEELLARLNSLHKKAALDFVSGSKVLEIKLNRVNKGKSALQFILNDEFILAIGDDTTDEDLFRALPDRAVTVHVGVIASLARYLLRDSTEVVDFLHKLNQEHGTTRLPRAENGGNPSLIQADKPDLDCKSHEAGDIMNVKSLH